VLESWVASLGLKLNELAGFESGPGVILLALKDGGKKASGISYGDLRTTLRIHLGPRLERYGIKTPEPMVEVVLKHLTDYQSIFTMAAR
jgi:hypothetical protein